MKSWVTVSAIVLALFLSYSDNLRGGEFRYFFTGLSVSEGTATVLDSTTLQGTGPVKFHLFVAIESIHSQEEIDAAFARYLTISICREESDPPQSPRVFDGPPIEANKDNPGCREYLGALAWTISLAVDENGTVFRRNFFDQNNQPMAILVRRLFRFNVAFPALVMENVEQILNLSAVKGALGGDGQYMGSPDCSNPFPNAVPAIPGVCDVETGHGAISFQSPAFASDEQKLLMENSVNRVLHMIIESSFPEEGEPDKVVEIKFRDGIRAATTPIPQANAVTIPPGENGNLTTEDISITLKRVALNRVRGDCTANGRISVADAYGIIRFQFQGREVECEEACDADGSGFYGIEDVILVLNYLFLAGPPPGSPGSNFPSCDAIPGCGPYAAGDFCGGG